MTTSQCPYCGAGGPLDVQMNLRMAELQQELINMAVGCIKKDAEGVAQGLTIASAMAIKKMAPEMEFSECRSIAERDLSEGLEGG